MRIAATIIALTVAASAAPAFAQGERLTDVEYLQAARCAGLVSSDALGATDSASMEAFMKAQSRGRASFIVDKADQIAATAKRSAKRAAGQHRASLVAEREACARYAG
ncbi:MAG TPA: hypothetical protein VF138_02430 [Caulobacteraceae bacterium]